MMDYPKVMEVAHTYATKIEEKYKSTGMCELLTPERMEEKFAKMPENKIPLLVEYRHHLWMCVEILKGEMSLTKAMRWLGWLNFYAYKKGWYTLEEVKNLSRPAKEE